MGAAASLRLVYTEALNWFQTYVDSETYQTDFNEMDKDSDGDLTFGEVQRWVMNKAAKEGGSWLLFKDHPQILAIAHKNAGLSLDANSSVHASKVVDIGEFRNMLIQMFSVSILLAHFEHADDIGDKQLTFDEFKRAVITFCKTHAHEELDNDQIMADFEMLDSNRSDTIGFVEVCNYCCRYIDPAFSRAEEEKAGITAPKFFGEDIKGPVIVNDIAQQGSKGPKAYYAANDASQKTNEAFDSLAKKLEREMLMADKVAEELDDQEAAAQFDATMKEFNERGGEVDKIGFEAKEEEEAAAAAATAAGEEEAATTTEAVTSAAVVSTEEGEEVAKSSGSAAAEAAVTTEEEAA